MPLGHVHTDPGPASDRPSYESPGLSAPLAPVPHHVLVCLDRSALAESVLPHAVALAHGCGAHLTLLHILEPRHGADAPTDPFDWEVRRAEASEYLGRIAARYSSPQLPIEVELGQGHAAEQIRTWADNHHVDFTVLCSHGEGGFTQWSLASTAHKLTGGAAGSLLFVPASAAPPSPKREVRYARILVPLDGSTRAESVVPLAVQLAKTHRSELILAHVVPVPELTYIGPPAAEDLDLGQRLVRRNERVARRYLEHLQARLEASGLRVRTVLARDGDVRGELAGIIEREGAGLVVLSAHGSTGRTDWPFGRVAAHLLAHATTPLLIVREPARGSPRQRAAAAGRHPVAARAPALALP